MKILIQASLLSLAFMTTPVLALVCEQFPTYSGIKITGMIGTDDTMDWSPSNDCKEGLPPLLSKPLVMYFSSIGGYIDRIDDFLDQAKKIFVEAKAQSGVTPTVIIYENCSSACIPILAGMNQMAANGLIHLVVDKNTDIGFHGCSDHFALPPLLRYTEKGTFRYLKYLAGWGASREWIFKHQKIFATADVTWFKPDEEDLKASGIISHAAIVEWTKEP